MAEQPPEGQATGGQPPAGPPPASPPQASSGGDGAAGSGPASPPPGGPGQPAAVPPPSWGDQPTAPSYSGPSYSGPPAPPPSLEQSSEQPVASMSYATDWHPPGWQAPADQAWGGSPGASPATSGGPWEPALPVDAVLVASAQGQPEAPLPAPGAYGGDWGGNGFGTPGAEAPGPGGEGPGSEPVVEVVPRWEKRKPRPFWERSRLLVLIAGVWGVLFWYAVSSDPLLSIRDGLVQTWNAKWWLAVLFAAELARQVHYLVSEHWGWWNHFWQDRFFGTVSQRTGKLNDWNRYRSKRVFVVLVVLAAIAIIAGAVEQENPVTAFFSLPGQILGALPTFLVVIFYMLFGVAQFVGIFWYLSRGGVETYMPDDVKTRFSHVWGQDAVLERVKESLVFLEDPESIESKGGYVPGGMLLWGPPGTGKTLMAEAVAGETGKPFVFVEPSAFINMFIGIGPLKVKGLFRKLRKLAVRYGGVIVFFDEADSLGNRGSLSPGGIFGPGGVQGMGAWPWSVGDCHGGAYLSGHSLSALLDSSTWHDRSAAPEERRRLRDWFFMGGGGNSSPGTLQALLAEMSGLSKPRGFFNRYGRRLLGMKPKPPPKYRILIMMATNRPDSLDEAMLRPGRIDRIYKVGYPSKAGRVRTYEGYFAKVQHELTPEDIDKLATITPYGTGATIKDLVNESLIVSLRHGHDKITWSDVLEAKRLKELGPPEDVEYVERERHAVAVHEACHAVVAFLVRKHLEIDLATIEKGGTYLGMVSSIKPEDRFTSWRSEFEADVMVSLASLAGERYFFAGDSSSGVSGDLEAATAIAGLMESRWGMGSTIASHAAQRRFGGGWPGQEDATDGLLRGEMGRRIEERLHELLERTEDLLKEHKAQVFALAHALETHKTLSGEDVEAVIEGRLSRGIDGRVYKSERFMEVFGQYHEHLLEAHVRRARASVPLPQPADWAPELALAAVATGSGDGDGHALVAGSGDGWPPASPASTAGTG